MNEYLNHNSPGESESKRISVKLNHPKLSGICFAFPSYYTC